MSITTGIATLADINIIVKVLFIYLYLNKKINKKMEKLVYYIKNIIELRSLKPNFTDEIYI